MADVLKAVQQDARRGRVTVSRHAEERMQARRVLGNDVDHAIKGATDQGDGTFELEGGTDIDGEPLAVVVKRERHGLHLITVM